MVGMRKRLIDKGTSVNISYWILKLKIADILSYKTYFGDIYHRDQELNLIISLIKYGIFYCIFSRMKQAA